MILTQRFYEKDVIAVSQELLGKILVHASPEGLTSGIIVETEAYRGPEDLAAHSALGRRTERVEQMYGEKGRAYIYFIYGMYWCFNVTAGNISGKPEAVLVRALEPLQGKDLMAKRRETPNVLNFTNGPAKLCMAMGLSKAQNKADLTDQPLYIKNAPSVPAENVIATTRIGVDYSGEWKDKPWRFYVKNSQYVSMKQEEKR